jgi:hypothetical protein
VVHWPRAAATSSAERRNRASSGNAALITLLGSPCCVCCCGGADLALPGLLAVPAAAPMRGETEAVARGGAITLVTPLIAAWDCRSPPAARRGTTPPKWTTPDPGAGGEFMSPGKGNKG